MMMLSTSRAAMTWQRLVGATRFIPIGTAQHVTHRHLPLQSSLKLFSSTSKVDAVSVTRTYITNHKMHILVSSGCLRIH